MGGHSNGRPNDFAERDYFGKLANALYIGLGAKPGSNRPKIACSEVCGSRNVRKFRFQMKMAPTHGRLAWMLWMLRT